MPQIFAATGLSLEFDGVPLFSELHLELFKGEVALLRGPSGAGKSTLLRMLAGLLGPATGLLVEGESFAALGAPRYRRRVTYVPQSPSLLPFSVAQNLRLAFSFKSSDTAFDEQAARHWLTRLGLAPEFWSRDATNLSVGEQQRVCLARSLLLNPKVLLLDEPTAALDPEAADRVEGVVVDWVKEHQSAALIITHQQTKIHASRSWSLADGQLKEQPHG